MSIEIKVLNKEFYEEHMLPSYATPGSSGIDLVSTVDHYIMPDEVKDIKTGIAIWIGERLEFNVTGLIVPRSGLGRKGLILANTIGVIDNDYQGELIVSVWNRNILPAEYIEITAGERIAQLLFVPLIKFDWKVVNEFSYQTERGKGGFGSTGK